MFTTQTSSTSNAPFSSIFEALKRRPLDSIDNQNRFVHSSTTSLFEAIAHHRRTHDSLGASLDVQSKHVNFEVPSVSSTFQLPRSISQSSTIRNSRKFSSMESLARKPTLEVPTLPHTYFTPQSSSFIVPPHYKDTLPFIRFTTNNIGYQSTLSDLYEFFKLQ